MIKPNKIQEWIAEIEERPMIAPFIVRTLSARVIELDKENETLRGENLSLRSGEKVQEYERKIAELEYQLELLKRQVQEGNSLQSPEQSILMVYSSSGSLLTIEFVPAGLITGQTFAFLQDFDAPHVDDIHLLAAGTQDELLYLYNTGRIETRKAVDLPRTEPGNLNWGKAFKIEMRSGERLVAILPITNVPLSEGCIQISRKGLSRLIPIDYFQSFLHERNIGKGVRTAADELFNLTLCNSADIVVLVSRSGYISALPAQRLSITLEEIIRLDMQDYLVAAFTIQADQNLAIALQTGQIILQANAWKDSNTADGSKKRLLLTGTKAGGVKVIGAGATAETCWAFRLNRQGKIYMQHIENSSNQKSSKTHPQTAETDQTIAFCIWQVPANRTG